MTTTVRTTLRTVAWIGAGVITHGRMEMTIGMICTIGTEDCEPEHDDDLSPCSTGMSGWKRDKAARHLNRKIR